MLQNTGQVALQTTFGNIASSSQTLRDGDRQFVFADGTLHIIRLLVPSDSDEAVVSVDQWPSKMRLSFPGVQQLSYTS